jgi:hypothetical protein
MIDLANGGPCCYPCAWQDHSRFGASILNRLIARKEL